MSNLGAAGGASENSNYDFCEFSPSIRERSEEAMFALIMTNGVASAPATRGSGSWRVIQPLDSKGCA
jgi:hypothetical protein